MLESVQQLMNAANCKEEVLKYLKMYKRENIIFTKKIIFVEKQEREFQGKKEIRYNCYFIFSKSRAHRYVLSFNDKLKVITAITLGRKTLNKMSIKEVLEGLK